MDGQDFLASIHASNQPISQPVLHPVHVTNLSNSHTFNHHIQPFGENPQKQEDNSKKKLGIQLATVQMIWPDKAN